MIKISLFFFLVIVILYLILSFKIIKCRRENKISLGFSKNKKLEYLISEQKNILEYSFLFFILCMIFEINLNPLQKDFTHFIFLFSFIITLSLFLIGRFFHFYAFVFQRDGKLRVVGMVFTFNSIFLIILLNLILIFF